MNKEIENTPAELKELRKEIARLKTENQELTSRVAEMEAARMGLASEFDFNVGNIHHNIRNLKENYLSLKGDHDARDIGYNVKAKLFSFYNGFGFNIVRAAGLEVDDGSMRVLLTDQGIELLGMENINYHESSGRYKGHLYRDDGSERLIEMPPIFLGCSNGENFEAVYDVSEMLDVRSVEDLEAGISGFFEVNAPVYGLVDRMKLIKSVNEKIQQGNSFESVNGMG